MRHLAFRKSLDFKATLWGRFSSASLLDGSPHEEGVVYYLQDGRVRGVLLWNVWDKVNAARELIAEPDPIPPENLRSRLN